MRRKRLKSVRMGLFARKPVERFPKRCSAPELVAPHEGEEALPCLHAAKPNNRKGFWAGCFSFSGMRRARTAGYERTSIDDLHHSASEGEGACSTGGAGRSHLPLRGKLGWMTPRPGHKKKTGKRSALFGALVPKQEPLSFLTDGASRNSQESTRRTTGMRAWRRMCATSVSLSREASYSRERRLPWSSTRKHRKP